jgi:hypothetical protein
LVDPITAATIGGPIARALLNPDRKKREDMACPEPTGFIPSWQLDERENGNLGSRTLLVLLDEPVLEAEVRVAVAESGRATRRAVERHRSIDGELATKLGKAPDLSLLAIVPVENV